MHEVSPSQIATAQRCMRRWYWQSVKGFREPTAPSAAFGSEVHAELEYRLQHGRWNLEATPAVLFRAQPAFDALCTFLGWDDVWDSDAFEVERDWRLEDAYALAARGRADLVLQGDNTVVDWKTTSGLQYAKTDAERACDPQVLLYVDAFVQEGLLELPADFLHVYTVTKGKPEAVVLRTTVTSESLSIGRKTIARTVTRMREIVEQDPDPQAIEHNPLSCNDFHKTCFQYDRCFAGSKTETEIQTMNSDFKALIAARKAEQAAREGHAPAVNPPDAPTAPQPAAEAEAPVTTKRRTGMVAAVAAMLSEDSPEEVEVVEDPAPIAKKRGRPAKQPVIESLPEDYETPACMPRTEPTTGAHTLLIGAFPLRGGGDWVLADEWLQPYVKTACENLRVAYWGLADFGKGKQAVMALVDAACKRGELPARMVLDRRSALGDAVAEIVMPYFANVFVKLG